MRLHVTFLGVWEYNDYNRAVRTMLVSDFPDAHAHLVHIPVQIPVHVPVHSPWSSPQSGVQLLHWPLSITYLGVGRHFKVSLLCACTNIAPRGMAIAWAMGRVLHNLAAAEWSCLCSENITDGEKNRMYIGIAMPKSIRTKVLVWQYVIKAGMMA